MQNPTSVELELETSDLLGRRSLKGLSQRVVELLAALPASNIRSVRRDHVVDVAGNEEQELITINKKKKQ